MNFHVKFICTFILLSHIMCSRSRRRLFNPCLFNVFTKFYISENMYFDLSRFASEKDSWEITYTHSNNTEANLRFAFCQRPESSNLICSDKSVYACIFTDTNYVVKNAGSRISGPFYRNGELQISIDNGEGFGNVKFSVLVRLNCSYVEEKPTFVSYHDYVVTVLWNTLAGCPIDENDTHNTCVISSPNGVIYNLRPLRHTVYHYDHRKMGHYRVNICGKKKKDECNTVCEYDDLYEEVEEFGTISQIALTGPKSSHLDIRYLDTSDDILAEVHLKCDRGSETHITRLSEVGHVHVYMNTIFACEPAHPRTIFQDGVGNSYNISALYHNAHNYKLKGPTEDLNYIFNLGGAVDYMPGIACEGAICLWDSRNNLSVSLGYAQLEPSVNDISILLKFAGGDKCGIGSNVHRAVIKLKCKMPGKDPEFESITHDCIHYIIWETPAACYYKYFKGSKCTVSEKTYSHTYDLNPLYNKTNNYVVTSPTNERFYINICGSIVGKCGSFESDVSVCWNNKAIGHINTEPIYHNGGIELKMTGEACRRNGRNSSITIKFLCEMDIHAEDHNKIQLEGKDEFNCTFVFVMYTSTVCTSALENYTCLATDQLGYEYDFKKLSRTNSNYVVKSMAEGNNVTFLLNVCQPVISEPDVMCPHSAMACIFTAPNPDSDRYMSLGKMSKNAFKINKEHHVELHYTEGKLCSDDSVGIQYETSTVIEFICDYNAKNSEPKFDRVDKCEYRFVWSTPVVCPLDSQKPIQQTSNIHEAGKDSVLSTDVSDHHFIKTEEKEKKTHELVFNPDKSKADVVSSEKEHMESKYAYEESAPEHSVDYISHAVRLKDLPDCFVMDSHGERIDLSTLMKKDWHVRIPPDKSIVFSVCHNLTSVKCNSNGHTGSCMNNMNTGIANNRLTYQSGHPGMPGKVILNYTGGDVCDSAHKYSTLLLFECSTEEEVPTFLTMTDDCVIVIKFVTPVVCVGNREFRKVAAECENYFERHASIVCPNRTDVFDSDSCLIHDENFTSIMNLTDFKESGCEVRSLAGPAVYMLELCRNNMKICNNSHICRKSGQEFVDYGNTPITTYDYARNAVYILYAGEECSLNARFHASIWLKCNGTHSWSRPSIIKETECIVVFEWESKHFCYYPNTSTGALIPSDGIKESSTSTGLLWIIMGIFALFMLAFALGRWQRNRKNSRLSDLLRHCISTPPTRRIRYSRDSEESSSIL